MAMVEGVTVRLFGKRLFSFRISRVLLYVFLTAFVLFTSLPLIYVVSTAFKPIEELYLFPPRFFVQSPTAENFRDLFETLDNSAVPFSRNLFNSLFTTVVTVAVTVIMSSMAAFSLTKLRPKGHQVLFGLILAALMFSPYVTQIPNYLVVRKMGLLDSYWALILPKVAMAFNLFLMKQFCEQLPDPLLEAARIDGAGTFTLFRCVVMPFLRPAWATLVVFTFVANWNDYFSALVFITDEAKRTLPLALQTLSGGAGAASLATAGAVAASALLMTLPTVLIYTRMQKRVVATMAHSGIK